MIEIWGVPKIRGTFLGVPVLRIIVYWGLCWGGDYHLQQCRIWLSGVGFGLRALDPGWVVEMGIDLWCALSVRVHGFKIRATQARSYRQVAATRRTFKHSQKISIKC